MCCWPRSELPRSSFCAANAAWARRYALSQEHDALLADGLHATWLKLKQCTTTRLAQIRLHAALTPPAGVGEWHVLLDGLDEGVNDLSPAGPVPGRGARGHARAGPREAL
ncbi:hypothetical protein WKI71_44850 [Streptomyces sp. MS1.AVA.1]|uniref:Transposase n=1 Tax=Streptomyces machairae TaxID=3134109 RepID=A0ABU8UVI5_9ACTN